MYTQNGESLYDALQVQLNRRVGTRLHFGANYTYSKTLAYARQQFVDDKLLKNIAAGTRPQAVNINFAYAIPGASKMWNNAVAKVVTEDWHLEGLLTFYNGVPLTINCTSVGQPIGYWTGTPSAAQTGATAIPFRCKQTGDFSLPEGTAPASLGSTSDPRLFYPFNPASFGLPPVNSLGIGNTPPTLFYGPGVESVDLSVYKQFRIKERSTFEIRAQAFNTFNHFNPANPNTTLNLNFNSGANSNTAFGTIPASVSNVGGIQIGGAQIGSRRMALSARFTF